jgi:hypothetical protein
MIFPCHHFRAVRRTFKVTVTAGEIAEATEIYLSRINLLAVQPLGPYPGNFHIKCIHGRTFHVTGNEAVPDFRGVSAVQSRESIHW